MEDHSTKGPKSLQELCEMQLLEQILQSDGKDDDLLELEPRFQQLLFQRMRLEKRRLQSVQERLDELKELYPLTDFHLPLGRSASTPHTTNDKLRDSILKDWCYEKGRPAPDEDVQIYWNSDEHLPSNMLCWLPTLAFDLSKQHFRYPKSDWSKEMNLVELADVISPQLLYYRLSTVFGMPPRKKSIDPPASFRVELRYKSDRSWLGITDKEGRAHVWYAGTGNACDEALKLLDYLVGATDNMLVDKLHGENLRAVV
jgi:hypothetical protein